MISHITIDQVRQLSIVDVVARYVDLKKAGANYRARSPFTNEKSPSFYVVPAKQIFKCFSSGKGGDGIRFVMEKEGIGYIDAIKSLSSQFNIDVKYESNGQAPGHYEEVEFLYQTNEAAANAYAKELLSVDSQHPAFMELMNKRRFTLDTLLQWQIGYAPGEVTGEYTPAKWNFLTKSLTSNGHYLQGIDLGLIKTTNEINYDAFRNRITFPIVDHHGRTVGFGARALQADQYNAKYLNSPNSKTFDKSKILFGLHYAAHAIRKQGFANLMEGYTDVISFHQAGQMNSVGTCGTALTDGHCKLLHAYTNKVLLIYDPDEAGQTACLRSVDLLLKFGFEVAVLPMPCIVARSDESWREIVFITQRTKESIRCQGNSIDLEIMLDQIEKIDKIDPDELIRIFPILDTKSVDEFIARYQIDAVLWKADQLLKHIDNPLLRNDRCICVARMLSLIPKGNAVMRDDYIQKICSAHKLKPKTLEKMIAEAMGGEIKKASGKVLKNKVMSLNMDPKKFVFFREFVKDNSNTGERFLDKIKIDKLKFVQLLSSFGFSRYETGTGEKKDDYAFVRINGNVISSITRDKIIDFIEHFIKNDYDFEAVKCEFVDAAALINTFYDQMRTIFSKDLFARVRQEAPILINKDKATMSYLYFKNGFVEITDKGYQLHNYDQMPGSIWDHQLKEREFKKNEDPLEKTPDMENPNKQNYKCVFADFVWKICGQNPDRFKALCSIIGYLVHDFYAYNLKMIYFTDSTISENNEGRTGKTLLMKMIGEVRSYCEIHGKNFSPYDDKRYETVKLGTQLVHINDISNKGKNSFELESMFNDITEGLHVRALYLPPFRQFSKLAVSGNKSLCFSGDSAIARVLEFELSNFFSLKNRPDQFYGHWLGRDWDSAEWNRFDNFICFCAQMFHLHGLQEPPVINLLERKLRDHSSPEFIELMDEISENLKTIGTPWLGYFEQGVRLNTLSDIQSFEFDKKRLFERFIELNKDMGKWCKVRKFYAWINLFCKARFDLDKPFERKTNGIYLIKFSPF